MQKIAKMIQQHSHEMLKLQLNPNRSDLLWAGAGAVARGGCFSRKRSDLANFRLIPDTSFDLNKVGKSAGNRKSVRFTESPNYPGYDLMGFSSIGLS